MNETFGQRLSRLRKEKGLTQEDVANRIVISPQAVSKWENDVSSPDILVLSSLADILGVSTDELLGRDDAPINNQDIKEEKVKEEKKVEEEVKTEDADEVVINKDGVRVNGHYYRRPDFPKKRHWLSWIGSSIIFGLALIAYILLGIFWKDQAMGWRMGWTTFLIAIVLTSLLTAIEDKRFCHFAYPILVVAAYVILGFVGDYTEAFAGWATFWFLFITIPAFYFIFGPIDAYIHRKIVTQDDIENAIDEEEDEDEDDD